MQKEKFVNKTLSGMALRFLMEKQGFCRYQLEKLHTY